MPFLYELMLEENQPEYTLLQRLIPEGTVVGTGEAVALLSDGTTEFHLPAPKQGLLVEWRVASGATIRALEPLARLVCEGAEVTVPGAVPERLG
ncbi:MAG: hypothetical protein ABI197_13000 [Granulicella sp.]